MIRAGEVFRVELSRLRMRPNVPAGMNLARLGGIADRLRCTSDDVDPPLLVVPDGPDRWQITDGRHRYVASYVAGRVDVPCQLDAHDLARRGLPPWTA